MNHRRVFENVIILCSGGLDSIVTSYYVKKVLGYKKIIILFFDYGQKSIIAERRCSKKCAKELNAEFIEIKLDFLEKISTSLINKPGKIKKLSKKDLKNTKKESEKFYVPCRNTLFISYGLAIADSLFISKKKIYDLFVGFKNEGKEAYPDTTPKFIKKINEISESSCSKKFNIKAPLIHKDKEDIILLGKKLGVKFENTFSCYVGKKKHCGICLACKLRQQGFYWAGIEDPTIYNN